MIQAGATAVLIVTLSPSTQNLEIPRFVDAFVGGGIALLVTAILLPLNPLRVINRAARPALDLLAAQLDVTAEALRSRDAAERPACAGTAAGEQGGAGHVHRGDRGGQGDQHPLPGPLAPARAS